MKKWTSATFFLPFLIFFVSCGGGGDGEEQVVSTPDTTTPPATDTGTTPPTEEEPTLTIDSLNVPVDFDWKTHKEFQLELLLLGANDTPLAGTKINIYDKQTQNDDEAKPRYQLLFSGVANSEGKILLNHSMRKEQTELYVKEASSSNNELLLLDLQNLSQEEKSITFTLYLN